MALSAIEAAVLKKIKTLRIPIGSSVLDVPCGKGALSAGLVQMGFRVHAADVDQSVHAVLKDHFRSVDLNESSLPWPDRTFDVVCSIEGIEHLEHPYHF